MSERIAELRKALREGTEGTGFTGQCPLPWRLTDRSDEIEADIEAANGWPVARDREGSGCADPKAAALAVAAVNNLPALLDIAEAARDAILADDDGVLLPTDMQLLRAALDRLR